MKGFIEVTTNSVNKYRVNISHIVEFGEGWIFILGKKHPNNINETYEEIKQLIINAQK